MELSLLCWPKVILLSGGHCTKENNENKNIRKLTIALIGS